MEIVERDARGEYTVHFVEGPDGNSMELVKRDCGDYFELMPRRIFLSHDGVTLTQTPQGGSTPVVPNKLRVRVPFPGVVMKLPKNLPEDTTERMKILNQIKGEATQKIARYFKYAYKMSASMPSNPDKVKEVVEQDTTDEVKKLSEEVKDVLNLH